MSELITKFFDLIEKSCKENPFALFLLSIVFLLCWLLYKLYKSLRREQKKVESERKRVNDERVDKVRAEEKLAIFTLRVVELEKQLQENKNQEAKLQNKLDIANEKELYLGKKNVELELENRWQKEKNEELEKENKKLKMQGKKNKS